MDSALYICWIEESRNCNCLYDSVTLFSSATVLIVIYYLEYDITISVYSCYSISSDDIFALSDIFYHRHCCYYCCLFYICICWYTEGPDYTISVKFSWSEAIEEKNLCKDYRHESWNAIAGTCAEVCRRSVVRIEMKVEKILSLWFWFWRCYCYCTDLRRFCLMCIRCFWALFLDVIVNVDNELFCIMLYIRRKKV